MQAETIEGPTTRSISVLQRDVVWRLCREGGGMCVVVCLRTRHGGRQGKAIILDQQQGCGACPVLPAVTARGSLMCSGGSPCCLTASTPSCRGSRKPGSRRWPCTARPPQCCPASLREQGGGWGKGMRTRTKQAELLELGQRACAPSVHTAAKPLLAMTSSSRPTNPAHRG